MIPKSQTSSELKGGQALLCLGSFHPSPICAALVSKVRLSGMAINTQIALALNGFAPAISAAVVGSGPNGWVPVAGFMTARETCLTPMNELSRKHG